MNIFVLNLFHMNLFNIYNFLFGNFVLYFCFCLCFPLNDYVLMRGPREYMNEDQAFEELLSGNME